MVIRSKLTVEEFDRWIALPENAGRSFEFIGGEIIEVVSNNYSSIVAGIFLAYINLVVLRGNLGWVTGADGGYWVSGEKYIPDVGFISRARQPEPCEEAWNPAAPDLAVEVLSPGNTHDEMRFKLVNYLRAGTTVWVANPEEQSVEVFSPQHAPLKLSVDDTLTGGAVLPGFSVPVRACFPKAR